MNEYEGFVVEYRKIMQWEWYTDVNTAHLFRHCILRANYQDTVWRGIAIKKGSFITSLQTLSTETGLTVKQVRIALEKLEKTGEVANCSTSKYRIITVKNYDNYQQQGKQNGKQNGKVRAKKGQGEGKQNGKLGATDNNINISNDIFINNPTSDSGVCPQGTHTAITQKQEKTASSAAMPLEGKPAESPPLSQGEWRKYCELKGFDEYRAADEWVKVRGHFSEKQTAKVREFLKNGNGG